MKRIILLAVVWLGWANSTVSANHAPRACYNGHAYAAYGYGTIENTRNA